MEYIYGKEECEKYKDLIRDNCFGEIISKKIDEANCSYGLISVANRLGIDMWDLLRALEGMLYEGYAIMIDDSTYKIK